MANLLFITFWFCKANQIECYKRVDRQQWYICMRATIMITMPPCRTNRLQFTRYFICSFSFTCLLLLYTTQTRTRFTNTMGKTPAPTKWNDSIRFDSICHGHVYLVKVEHTHTHTFLQYNFTAHRNVECVWNDLSWECVNIVRFSMCSKLEIKIFSVFWFDLSASIRNSMVVLFFHFFDSLLSCLLAILLRLSPSRKRIQCAAHKRKKKNNKRNPTHSRRRVIFVMFIRLEFYSRLRNSYRMRISISIYPFFFFIFIFFFLVIMLITWPTFLLSTKIHSLSSENILRVKSLEQKYSTRCVRRVVGIAL